MLLLPSGLRRAMVPPNISALAWQVSCSQPQPAASGSAMFPSSTTAAIADVCGPLDALLLCPERCNPAAPSPLPHLALVATVLVLALVALRAVGAKRWARAREVVWLAFTFQPPDDEDRPEGKQPETILGARATFGIALELVLPDAPLLLAGVATAVLRTGCQLATPILQGMALDGVTAAAAAGSGPEALREFEAGPLLWLLALIAGCSAVQACADAGYEKVCNKLGDSVMERGKRLWLHTTIAQELGYLEGRHSSSLHRSYNQLWTLHNLAGHQVPQLLESALTVAVSLVYMLRADRQTAALVFTVAACQACLELISDKVTRLQGRVLQRIEKRASRLLGDVLQNAQALKRFSLEQDQSGKFDRIMDQDREARQRLVTYHATARGLSSTLSLGSGLLGWYLGLRGVMRSTGSIGQLSTFLLLSQKVRGAVHTFLSLYARVSRQTFRLGRSFAVLLRAPSIRHNVGSMPDPAGPCHVRLEGVSFAYEGRDDPVLNAVDLDLAPNSVTALCGPSGGGKSTIASLILRDYDPTAGRITLDGVDIRELRPQAYHAITSVVSQDPQMLAVSIEDNIRLASPGASRAEVEAAARLANAHAFIEAFPDGYGTMVGERGITLSGGQRQRVAIARALLTNPKVLVLDEATSALDACSEHLVQEALERVMVGRTTLVVAHRLSTIQNADVIHVIKAGRVAERGTHQELMARGGEYLSLVSRQMQGGAPAEDPATRSSVL